ncbi:4Fe-4S binding domain-containing protein [Desulfatibacillum alkenivorans DSM 16219]|jgi:coenzyme F420-reducing hydrogenase delta subunit/ferredoxin|uniref:4Fe-4S binding domain-containing protein n=1 Tax=Desulfatibacillum alkenivorans DSM 16219 TaxID=1121393 RepID=A0A1M6XHI3_9BACT|nr:hydrogenase iron-sulfur subunit [Desulfatibacillum alkenivorans]SHL05265.1 4Fe-4S binding domain-containing protein [Desulfatibacillum alkenivorans DSM 16219]
MSTAPKVGVFLCECGDKIKGNVDMGLLAQKVVETPDVAFCKTMPYPCLKPGIAGIKKAIADAGLDRIVIAGCSRRLMMKKFENEMKDSGLDVGQIAMVNLRDHVALVHPGLEPAQRAEKGVKLIRSSVADLAAMVPGLRFQISIEKPVLIMGDGIATYAAAQQFARHGVESIMALSLDDEEEIRLLHERYPGERQNFGRVRNIMKAVEESPLVQRITVGDPIAKNGKTGNYSVSFENPEGGAPIAVEAGLIMACLDGEMESPGPEFGHNGDSVICQSEADEHLWTVGPYKGNVVFWINDVEAGTPEFAHLSMRGAWSLGRAMVERSDKCNVTIFHNQDTPLPLSAEERRISRKLGIQWVAYDGKICPTVQARNLTYLVKDDGLERELPWDQLILSPVRVVGRHAIDVASLLNLDHKEGRFLRAYHAQVRPENVGRKEAILAGSAAYPCDLSQALAQGRRAAIKVAETIDLSKDGKLFSPAIVSVIDLEKCIGCGQCEELCECGAIQVVEGIGGAFGRAVDPLICTGGGTGAAACPEQAMYLQNASTIQREAAAGALAKELAPGEVAAFGCTWGGYAAADNVAKSGLAMDPRLHMIYVPCVGQIDATVMAKALLDGANGVILFGCVPEECHHSYGVDHGWSRVNMLKKLLALAGFDRKRIALAHADFNNPEGFVKTVEGYTEIIAGMEPIERSPQNLEKLHAIYDTTKNSRVRLLLSAALRRPWESVYRGAQRHALEYDQEFAGVLAEEFAQTRLTRALKAQGEPQTIKDLAVHLDADKDYIAEMLMEMASEGKVNMIHKQRKAHFMV